MNTYIYLRKKANSLIKYKDPIGKLKAKGYTTTDLRKEGVLSQSVVSYLHNDKYVNLRTIDKICQLLDCKIEDVVEILPDKSEK